MSRSQLGKHAFWSENRHFGTCREISIFVRNHAVLKSNQFARTSARVICRLLRCKQVTKFPHRTSIHSIIHSLRGLLQHHSIKVTPDYSTAKKKSLQVSTEKVRENSRKQVQCQRLPIPEQGTNHGEGAILLTCSCSTGKRDDKKSLLSRAERATTRNTQGSAMATRSCSTCNAVEWHNILMEIRVGSDYLI